MNVLSRLSLLQSQWTLIFLGGLCYYLALPPTNWFPLAFLVPVFWGYAILRAGFSVNKKSKQSGGNAPTEITKSTKPVRTFKKRYVYLTGCLFWGISIWWISCPHPATTLGLAALTFYLSAYWVLFFVSARWAVHRFRVPLPVAMPVCWIGCEYLRCHIFGGFSFCALEHSFYKVPGLIQLASIGGQYLVGGYIFLIGALILLWIFFLSQSRFRNSVWTIVLIIALLLTNGVVLVPGRTEAASSETEHSCNVVALQGNIPISLNSDAEVFSKTFRQFLDLTYNLINERKQKSESLPNMIIFPETVCPIAVLDFAGTVKPSDAGLTEIQAGESKRQLQSLVDQIHTPVLFGLSTFQFRDSTDPARLNSALFVAPTGSNAAQSGNHLRYDKINLVMFGEYVPLSQYLPDNFFIKTLCQEAGRGKEPVAMPLTALCAPPSLTPATETETFFAVNICFESSVPHFVRNQISTLQKQGYDVRVLVNISNDAWFRFSRQIDQHLATLVFRAVENGRWCITATNGGFSAIIRPDGTIQSVGKRGQAEAVEGTIYPFVASTTTIYQRIGDWYALLCAIAVIFCAAVAMKERRYTIDESLKMTNIQSRDRKVAE
ncbi:hypothetical protein FACS189454_07750 [Planctomycetales bacterium]|nr:hypothetical protein FACS189454_07750 [Planctomycetales bacterium]